MHIELLGYDCPSLPQVTVGPQRGREVVDAHPAGGDDLRWLVEVTLVEGPDWRGPFVHGRPGSRFLYLCWLRGGEMFRRAKLMLDAVPAQLWEPSGHPGLRGRVRLTMADGSPTCAAVRPPDVEWSMLPAGDTTGSSPAR